MKRKNKKPKGPKRLIRFLEPGDRLVIKGVRGKPVKHFVSSRNYVLEVRRKGKLYGYVNNTTRTRTGVKPTPKPFTKTMISRLKHTTRVQTKLGNVKPGTKFKIKSSRRMKAQIPKKVYKELRRKKGKAFNLRIKVKDRANVVSSSTFIGGRMTDQDLQNLITSKFLFTISQLRIRVSSKLQVLAKKDLDDATRDEKSEKIIRDFRLRYERLKRQYVEEAEIQFEYRDIEKPKRRISRRRKRIPKDRQ